MPIDFKRELETAARNMILIHEPHLLIKMILRTCLQKIGVTHASILLHDPDKDTYILTVSRGSLSTKIPVGLARMDKDDPLVRFFREHKQVNLFGHQALTYQQARAFLKSGSLAPHFKEWLTLLLHQMQILETNICIPIYFRQTLLGILLLGQKRNGRLFKPDEIDFFSALASHVAMALKNAELFRKLELESEKKHQLFLRIIVALAAAIEAKDYHTHGHTARVTNLSLQIAQRIGSTVKRNFDDEFYEHLHIASLLHDIGKIGVPEAILDKEGPLDEDEMGKVREHPLIGVSILKSINELQDPILGVKYHHERHDGSGYPEGLKGTQIPIIAAIIAVADAFDAMTTDRPYRRALYKESAVEEIKRLSGEQFNPQVVGAFLDLCGDSNI